MKQARRIANLPWMTDGKLKARPPVALIVVVGVEVKETSHDSAWWRFLRIANEINLPTDGTHLCGFRFNVKRYTNDSQ
jgi:hypothetical protein